MTLGLRSISPQSFYGYHIPASLRVGMGRTGGIFVYISEADRGCVSGLCALTQHTLCIMAILADGIL